MSQGARIETDKLVFFMVVGRKEAYSLCLVESQLFERFEGPF